MDSVETQEIETGEQLALLPDEPVEIVMSTIATSALDHEEVQTSNPDLRASVTRLGILQPLLVRHEGDGYHLIDGRRRLDAARRGSLPTIPVAIVIAGDIIADTMTLSANAIRRVNIIAETEAIQRLVGHGATEKEIFYATRMSIPTIRKRIGLLQLAPPLMAAFREGKMAPTVAEAAAKLAPIEQASLAMTMATNGKLTATDVREIRSVRQQQAAALLPDSLFTMDEQPEEERAGEPVEAILAAELQSIIDRLPPHAAVQGVIRRSIAYAAEQLADIATGCYGEPEVNEDAGYEDEEINEQTNRIVWMDDLGEDRDYGDSLDGRYTEAASDGA